MSILAKFLIFLLVAVYLVFIYSCCVMAAKTDKEIERDIRALKAMKGEKLE